MYWCIPFAIIFVISCIRLSRNGGKKCKKLRANLESLYPLTFQGVNDVLIWQNTHTLDDDFLYAQRNEINGEWFDCMVDEIKESGTRELTGYSLRKNGVCYWIVGDDPKIIRKELRPQSPTIEQASP